MGRPSTKTITLVVESSMGGSDLEQYLYDVCEKGMRNAVGNEYLLIASVKIDEVEEEK